MIVIFEIAVKVWAILFVASLITEFALNRKPVLVAVIVSCLGFVGLAIWDWQAVNSEFSDGLLSLYASMALMGVLPSLAGAGLARFIKLWGAGKDGSEDSINPAEE